MRVSSYYQRFVLLDDVHGLEGVQLFYYTRKAVFTLPYKVETKPAGRFILKLHLHPVGGSNGCEHGVERYIIENVGSLTPSPSPKERGVIRLLF